MQRVRLLGFAVAAFWVSACQCGFQSVGECPGPICADAGRHDAGVNDAGQHDAGPQDAGLTCDGGTPIFPHLCLAPAQPASCPFDFPANGQPCSVAAVCQYLYPPGVAPSGCQASCESGDGGLSWNVPLCF